MAPTRRVNLTFSHTVAASESGDSFLSLLCRRFPYHGPAEWQTRIASGHALLNGASSEPQARLRLGMKLTYTVEDYEEPAVPISFQEIVAQENLALVHKPAGLPVHKTGKIFVHTLANLYRKFKGNETWAPLNRLDVETSGIVAFGRGDAVRHFSSLEPGTVWKKLYLAAVTGEAPEEGRIDLPLAENPNNPVRSRMDPNPNGKPAVTLFRRLDFREGRSLLLIRILTGRKHQIRAHLAFMGLPIVGDKVYSHGGRFYLKRLEGELDDEDLEILGAPHHLLHAFHLEIRDENGAVIEGSDFDLPESFSKAFPNLATDALSILTGEGFEKLKNWNAN